jgi:SH3-like domain-containing protein
MRSYIQLFKAITCLVLFAAIEPLKAEGQDSPLYVANVIVNDAALRAGPGTNYYAVDMLERGTNVEVYKSSEGWCAIRPPEGCFCWVPARQIRLDSTGRLGQVTDPKAVAWIGSNLARPAKHQWQIQLQVGEPVAIIGEKRFERKSEGTSETWYKIEPPSGEFRWIEARFLSKPAVGATQVLQASATNSPEGEPTAQNDLADGDTKEPQPLPVSPALAPAPISRSPAPIDRSPAPESLPNPVSPPASGASGRRGAFRDVTPGREDSTTSSSVSSGRSSTSNASPGAIPNKQVTFVEPLAPENADQSSASRSETPSYSFPQQGSGDLDNFADQLAQLETQFALDVANRNPAEWNLAPLKSRAQQLADRGASPLERGSARRLLERITEYENHQQQAIAFEARQAATAANTGAIAKAERPVENSPGAPWKPADAETPAPQDAPPTPDNEEKKPSWINKFSEVVGSSLKGSAADSAPTHFDARGKLQEVRVRDKTVDYPRYALLDDEGTIAAFIDSPVVKLEKYVGKQVGVYGRRGLHTASQTTYVEVVELVDLEITQRTKPMRTTFGTIR